MNNFGMKVKVIFKNGNIEYFRNITEIHYNYRNEYLELNKEIMIAFESDINGTGCTHNMDEIQEFETKLENKKEEGI